MTLLPPALARLLRAVFRLFKDLGFTRWRHLMLWFGILTVLAVGVAIHDHHKERVRGDLTLYSLEASRVMYAGGNPYDKGEVGKNYKYLPLNAALLGPLTMVSVPVAQGIWMAINVGLLILCYHNHQLLLRKTIRIPWWVWAIALALTIRFTYANLKMGQWNTSVYCLMFIGFVMARRSPFLGGMVIGLAGALKFMPAFLLFYFAAVRDWRAFQGLLFGLVFWLLVFPSLLLGPSRHGELLHNFVAKSERSVEVILARESVIGESLHATLYGLLVPAPRETVDRERTFNIVSMDPTIARPLVKGLMVLLLAAAFLFTWSLGRVGVQRSPLATLMLVGLWFTVFLCITPSARTAHLLTLFTPALGLALVASLSSTPSNVRRWAIVCLVIAFVSVLVSSRIIPDTTYHRTVQVYGSYTLSIVSLLVGCTIWLIAFQRRALMAASPARALAHEDEGSPDGLLARWLGPIRTGGTLIRVTPG